MAAAPRVWLFDLDNTLHNARPHIFPHIHRRMTAYIVKHLALSEMEANAMRLHYWQRYGATLLGLMRHHGTDPDHFLAATHDFERLEEMIVFEPAVHSMLRRLPGRRFVFSNAPRHYVRAVLKEMSVDGLFEDALGIEDLGYQPKPGIASYRKLLHAHRLDPARCIMLEDSAANLRTAKRLGMRTVLVGRSLRVPAYVDLKLRSIIDLRRQYGRLLR